MVNTLTNLFKKTLVFLLVSFFWTISPSHSGVFKAKTFTLKNGLQVVLIENHIAPVVNIQMCVKVGCADDPIPVFGISHFLEHMMLKGTRKYPGDQFTRMIQEEGGDTNAFTNCDSTVYVTTIASSKLDFMLEKEADRLQNLNLRAEDVNSEKEVVQEERRMRYDNSPTHKINQALQRAIYWTHPYGIPLIGHPHNIDAYTREIAFAHYKTYYCPNNTVLIVAGDVTLEQLKPLVEKHFGSLPPNKNLPKRQRVKEPDHQGVTVSVTQENPRIEAVHHALTYKAPERSSPHYYPLLVMTQIMSGNALSRLPEDMVEDKKIAVAADCGYDGELLDENTFSFSVVVAPESSLETVKAQLYQHMHTLLEKGVTEDEVKRAKRDLLAHFAFARDGNETGAAYFKKLLLGTPWEEIENLPDFIQKVTAKDIKEAVKVLFSAPPLATQTIYPKGKKPGIKKENTAPGG